jgi:hypothetical protein
MATEVLKSRKVWIDGYQFNNQLDKVEMDHGADEKDDTTLDKTTRTFAPNTLKSTGVAMEGFVDFSAGVDSIDKKLFDQISLDGLPIAVSTQTGLAGTLAYLLKATLGSYVPGASVGDLLKFSASAAAQGELVRATIIVNLSDVTSTSSSSGQQIGAIDASAGEVGRCALFVTKADGTTPTLDVVIESDDNGSFTSATTRFTFTQKTAIGSEYLDLATSVTDDYWRITYTLGGTSPDFDFAVMMGIH